jgi:hypothetical protein
VSISYAQVSSSHNASAINELQTFLDNLTIPLRITLDMKPVKDEDGFVTYCIRRLEHSEFEYQIMIVSS